MCIIVWPGWSHAAEGRVFWKNLRWWEGLLFAIDTFKCKLWHFCSSRLFVRTAVTGKSDHNCFWPDLNLTVYTLSKAVLGVLTKQRFSENILDDPAYKINSIPWIIMFLMDDFYDQPDFYEQINATMKETVPPCTVKVPRPDRPWITPYFILDSSILVNCLWPFKKSNDCTNDRCYDVVKFGGLFLWNPVMQFNVIWAVQFGSFTVIFGAILKEGGEQVPPVPTRSASPQNTLQ